MENLQNARTQCMRIKWYWLYMLCRTKIDIKIYEWETESESVERKIWNRHWNKKKIAIELEHEWREKCRLNVIKSRKLMSYSREYHLPQRDWKLLRYIFIFCKPVFIVIMMNIYFTPTLFSHPPNSNRTLSFSLCVFKFKIITRSLGGH